MKTFSDFSLNLFCLLFGFFLGNLFPNVSLSIDPQSINNFPKIQDTRIELLLQTVSGTIPGPSQVGLLLLFISELINWTGKFFRTKQIFPSRTSRFFKVFPFFNSVKIGLLFGIFVDAFKVGS